MSDHNPTVPTSRAAWKAEAEVRRIRADEWRELRDLRLKALADAPLAFGSTYEREAAFDDDRWQQDAAAAWAGMEQVTFVALNDTEPVGMARGYQGFSEDADRRPVVWLMSVYVDPRWRGRGLARRLSAEVVEWARDRGAAEVLLHVAEWNEPARRLYDALDFTPTGGDTTLAHDPRVREIEMRLRL